MLDSNGLLNIEINSIKNLLNNNRLYSIKKFIKINVFLNNFIHKEIILLNNFLIFSESMWKTQIDHQIRKNIGSQIYPKNSSIYFDNYSAFNGQIYNRWIPKQPLIFFKKDININIKFSKNRKSCWVTVL